MHVSNPLISFGLRKFSSLFQDLLVQIDRFIPVPTGLFSWP